MGRDLIDWARVMRLHDEGRTHVQIARAIGRRPTTVGRGLRERGVHSARTWSRRRRRHGRRIYGIWNHLRRRCDHPAHPGYRDHGAKGIRVADAWHDFDAFYDWALSAGYAPGLRLARHNRARNFTPANCHWVRPEKSARRSRPARVAFLVRAFGESKGQMAWARDPRCRVKQPALRDRLAAGWPAEEAISAPAGSQPSRLVRPPKQLRKKRGTRARIDWNEARSLHLHEELSEQELALYFGATLDAIRRGLRRLGVRRRRVTPTLDPEWMRLNTVWRNLLARCDGARRRRKIRVAPEWREFEVFYQWARASGSRKGLWLTRKHPRGDYSPQDCEWVSRAEATRRRLASA